MSSGRDIFIQNPTSLRLLIFPFAPQGLNIEPANGSSINDRIRLFDNGDINHLPVQRPSAPPPRLGISHRDPDGPLHFFLPRRKSALGDVDLARMDALLTVETQPLTAEALLLHRRAALDALE